MILFSARSKITIKETRIQGDSIECDGGEW